MKYKGLTLAIILILIITSLAGTALPVKAESTPVITLSPISGTFGTAIAITGNGFASGAKGQIWFDTNGNGLKDSEEPYRMISTTPEGELPKFTRLTAPKAPGGDYKVLIDIPGGDTIEAESLFTITSDIMLNKKTGYSGTTLTISGQGFAPQASGEVWFDTNSNGKPEDNEPRTSLTCDENGVIPPETMLTTPAAGPGKYFIQADLPEAAPLKLRRLLPMRLLWP